MKKFVKAVLVIAVLAAGWAAYRYALAPSAGKYVYRTQPVSVGSITATVSATGRVSAVEMVDVGTQVSGKIREIFVDFNSQVKLGDSLALLDPDVLESQVASARASLTVAEAGVTTARANLREAERKHARNQELWSKQLIAKSELDATETSLAVARANVAESSARAVQSRESLRQAETNLSYASIKSPIDGVVVNKAVEVGQTVAASFNTPTLFSIAKDLTQMQIQANIDEADIGSIKAGQKARVTFDTWPDETFEAEVSQIRLSPTTVSGVVTYTVILKIDNSDRRLLPGMTANLNIITMQRDSIVRIPAAALRFSPPADEIAKIDPSAEKKETQSTGGLIAVPRRPNRGERGSGSVQKVWVVGADGRLVGSIEIDEIGVSDRTWIEPLGSAADELKDGMTLAVAFEKENQR